MSTNATPYLVIDRDVMQVNLTSMAVGARTRGLTLRPHAKTHKCIEIARQQLALGAVGLTVATVGEAEVFAAAGVTDLFIAYPIWASGERGRRLRAVAEQATLTVGVDSQPAAELLAAAVPGVRVLVEVDCGQHRSGVDPVDAGAVAVTAARAGLTVEGVFTFPGHSYAPEARAQAAADERDALARAAGSLRAAGIQARVRSGGSTPSVDFAEAGELTELRPGVYVFNDAQQVELGSCAWGAMALWAQATVVSRRGSTVILDAGSKTLGADRPAWATGWGRLPDHPEARVVALSEHHATVLLPPGPPVPELGEILRIVPNHVCNAINLADELVVVSGGVEIDRWPIAAKGRNS